MNKAVLTGVLLITALHAFDELVLVIALPAIAGELAAARWYGLIIASYILASIIGMAWSGKQMDATSPRYILYVAACFFGCGLLLAIFSQNTAMFMLARIFQGVGGGIGWTLAFGLISMLATPLEKPHAVAAMDVAWIVPSLLAPLIGGLLVDHLDWRWIFFLQLLPLFGALLLISPRISSLDKGRQSLREVFGGFGHIADALQIAFAVGMLLYALGRPPGLSWLLLPVSIIVIRRPLSRCMPAGWLGLKTPLSAALFSTMTGFLVFYGMEAYQPLYLIEVRGMSTMSAGLVLTAASVSWMSASVLTARKLLPRWLSHYSARLLGGVCLLVLSLILFAPLLFRLAGPGWAYAVWCVAGFGMGLGFNTARATAMEHSPEGQQGFVAGAISLCASLGLSLSSGIGGALWNQVSAAGGSLNLAIGLIWVFALVVGVLTAGLLWKHWEKRDWPENP